MQGKKILITGANGMLGSQLATYFAPQNKLCVVDVEPSIFEETLASYSIDLTDVAAVKGMIQEVNPDIIMHCAGLVNVEVCEREPELANKVNIEATRYLAENCTADTLFVYVSTDQVYGSRHSMPENTKDLVQNNVYAATKFMGEGAVKSLCPKHIITRTNIFGWNRKAERESSAEWIINSLKSGQTIFLFNDYIFSPIYVGTFARILDELMDMNYTGVVNLGASDYCSKLQFGEELIRIIGGDLKNIQSKSLHEHDFLAARTPDMRMNTSLLTSLGIKVPGYKESILEFAHDNPNP